jgi:pyruvate formate lyase activating enzyme
VRIDLPIVGYRMLSLSDYPNCLAATVTVPGCNFRCPFCTKTDLVHHYTPMEKTAPQELLNALWPRLGFLDAVTVTGGEPLLHRALPSFLRVLKYRGYKTKLDTNASKPIMLRYLLEKKLVDFYSVRLIAPLHRYTEVTRYKIKPETMTESIRLIRRSDATHEFRFTPVPGVHDMNDVQNIASTLAGSRRLVLEAFDAAHCEDQEYRVISPYSKKEMENFRDLAAPYFAEVVIE